MLQAAIVEHTAQLTAQFEVAIAVGEAFISHIVELDAFIAIAVVLASETACATAEHPGTQWILPFQNFDTVPKALRTLELIVQVHTAAAADGWVHAHMADVLAWAASRTVTVLERAFDSVKAKLLWQRTEPEPGAATPLAAAIAMHQQLTAGPTLRVLAEAAGYVHEHVWPVAMLERSSDIGGEASVPPPPARRLARGVFALPLELRRDCSCAGARLVAVIGNCVHDAVTVCDSLIKRQRISDPHAAAHLVAAIHDSGVLERVCAALLAAPPYPQVPLNATAVDGFTTQLCSVVWHLLNALLHLAGDDPPFAGCASALLSGPAVQRLRWALLEQVAASAPGGTGELLLPRRGGEAEQGGGGSGGVDSSCGRGASNGDAAGGDGSGTSKSLWPLFQRHTLRLMFGPTTQLTKVLTVAIEAAAPGEYASLFAEAARQNRNARRPAYVPSVPQAVALAARVVRALCARAEYLGENGTVARNVLQSPPPSALAASARYVENATGDLLRVATEAEVAACAPDLMAMYAWQLRLLATPMGVMAGHKAVRSTLTQLWMVTAGASAIGRDISMPCQAAGAWKKAPPAGRAACVRRLLPTRLMRSLDFHVRAALSKGGDDKATHDTLSHAAHIAYEVLGPLLWAKLGGNDKRQALSLPAQQQQHGKEDAESKAGTAEAREGVCAVSGGGHGGGRNSGAACGGSSAASGEPQGEWDPLEDLGLLVTLAKYIRRELAGGREPLGGSALPLTDDTWLLVCSLPIYTVCGRPRQALSAEDAGMGLGGNLMALDAAPCGRVAREVAALVCRHTLPLMARVLEKSADAMQRFTDPAALANATGYGLTVPEFAGPVVGALLHALRSLPPALLLSAQARRVAVAAGRVVQQAERLLAVDGAETMRGYVSALRSRDSLRSEIRDIVTLLSCDRELQAACPGWVWGTVLPVRSQHLLDLEALAAAAASPSLTPPRPVLLLPVPASSPFLGLRWQQHAHHSREVVAMARAAVARDVPSAPAWALGRSSPAADDDAARWPPRRVRMCGSPRCGNFSGPAEAGLDFKTCGGCRVMRYCDAACQKEHWGQGHKEECRRG